MELSIFYRRFMCWGEGGGGGGGARTCPHHTNVSTSFNFGSTSSLSLDVSPLNLESC